MTIKNRADNQVFMPRILLTILAAAVTFGCASRAGWYSINGSTYRCPNYTSDSTCITLTMLKEDCRVEFVPGVSIPPEYSEKIIMIKDGIEKEVKGPNDLHGCVYLWSASDALAYLRFFSSFNTLHLFDEQKLEIYPTAGHRGCIGVCLSTRKWTRLCFQEASVNPVGVGYEVTRYVIKPIPKEFMPTIYKETVFVGRYGDVRLLKEEEISSHSSDTEGLFFPQYL